MNGAVSRLAVYGSKRQQPYLAYISDFVAEVRSRGIALDMHAKLYDYLLGVGPALLEGVRRVPFGEVPEVDAGVSLGGDGTFLRTAQWLGPQRIPLVGVNTGHLGFLSALAVEELPELPAMLAGGAFTVEHRCVLQVEGPKLPPAVGCFALNEVALQKEESASMISADVDIDGVPLARYRADGLIIATSTGSTAYNLSVGGPIVQPTVPVWVLSPVAAHSLSMRPLVVGADSCLRVVAGGRASHFRLALDGRSVLLESGTELFLRRADFDIAVMRRTDRTFADTLRRKLHWAD